MELISLFDNSVYGSESAGEDKQVILYPYSRGKYIALDHVHKICYSHQGIPAAEQGHSEQIPRLASDAG